ncbi:MAG TPA: hypothetical protein GXZ74_00010 [Tissierellia bacterium]|nr:hypothetical protein [Tissierellia bacterium]
MKKHFWIRFLKLIFGLFLHGLGIVMQIQANIGYAPWDVLHVGLAQTIGLTIGQASISVGLMILLIDLLLKEPLGLGTILNMLLVGLFVDLIMSTGLIPVMSHLIGSVLLLFLGLVVLALGVYFYIGSGFGAGPRDTLMVALNRRLNVPIGIARSGIEFTALVIGWLLGGMVGIGTIMAVILIGFILQSLFRLLRFEPKDVAHETLTDYLPAKK